MFLTGVSCVGLSSAMVWFHGVELGAFGVILFKNVFEFCCCALMLL